VAIGAGLSVPESATAKVVPESTTSRVVPESATAKVMAESVAAEVVAESVAAEVVAEGRPVVASGCMQPAGPAMVRAVPSEAVAMVIVAKLEMPRPMMPWSLPAPHGRVTAEVTRPRLRPQLRPGVMVVMDRAGAIAHDDAEAERRPHICVHRVGSVRRNGLGRQRQGAEGGRQEEVLTHRCLPSRVRKRASSLHRAT
jgi:hypothetical protein